MASSEDAAAHTPVTGAPPAPETTPDMDQEAKMLMHDERSCIFETRIERADLCRQRGSAQFKAGDIGGAVKWYERALYHVDFDEGTWHFEFTKKNRADVNVVRLPVYLNLAACFLAQGAPKSGKQNDELLAKVVENANLALAIDPDNDKALYRGGKALLLTGDFDGAREKLTKAAKNHPTDRNIRETMATLKKKLAEQKKEEKERWGGRLLDEKEEVGESKDEGKSQQQQLKKPSETNALWMFAIVLIGIALALGQLSFVE
ncbi:Tetratricopeptide TPR1 [Phytophthora cinnamomi]|uniref:Tetratricopeptide TPR1 n=1 Tax=Phytophthora cinnamomi TaxID=4785 RepID=UPI00355A1756|nr:Tetratricopeptide TPR1 [Phytophthora cinnamomi]